MPKGDKTPYRYLLFANAYLREPNATEAARTACYKGSDAVLAVQGSRLLRNAKIQELISKRIEEVVMSANECLLELSDIAKSDWRDHITIKRDREGNEIDVSLRLAEKIKALELVGKYHKLFTDRVEHSASNVESELIASIAAYAKANPHIGLDEIIAGYAPVFALRNQIIDIPAISLKVLELTDGR
jgi:phage terminase small subunit